MKAPALLLISGWATTSQMWDDFATGAKAWSRVETVDWWDCLNGDEENRLAGAVARSPGPVVLVGWSLGGMLAIEASLASPGQLRGLVLISTCACFTSPPPSGAGNFSNAIRAMRAKVRRRPEVVLRQFFDLWKNSSGNSADVDSLTREAMKIDQAHLIAGLQYFMEKDFRTEIKDINLPVLVVHGGEDNVVPPEAGKWLASQMKGAQFRFLPQHGHALPRTAPLKLAKLVKSFLA